MYNRCVLTPEMLKAELSANVTRKVPTRRNDSINMVYIKTRCFTLNNDPKYCFKISDYEEGV